MPAGRPKKWKSPKELQDQIDAFYEWCEANDKRITVSRLAWWLDVDRKSLIRYERADEFNWLSTVSEEERKEYSNTIKKAKRRIQAEYEELLYQKGSNTGAIFTLKNNYDWKDKQEIVSTDKKSINDMTEEELNRRLEELKG